MLSVSLVSRVTARSLHDYVLGCQTPSGEWVISDIAIFVLKMDVKLQLTNSGEWS